MADERFSLLYSRKEREELERIRQELELGTTAAMMRFCFRLVILLMKYLRKGKKVRITVEENGRDQEITFLEFEYYKKRKKMPQQ